jgi:hypothetical protein
MPLVRFGIITYAQGTLTYGWIVQFLGFCTLRHVHAVRPQFSIHDRASDDRCVFLPPDSCCLDTAAPRQSPAVDCLLYKPTFLLCSGNIVDGGADVRRRIRDLCRILYKCRGMVGRWLAEKSQTIMSSIRTRAPLTNTMAFLFNPKADLLF